MLANPDPADWPMWRRTLEQLGLQPARSGQSPQRRAAEARLDAPARAGRPGRHAARPRRHHVLPESERHHASATTRRPASSSGSIAATFPTDVGEYFPAAPTNRNLAIYDNLILDNGADGYAYALDATHRQARRGRRSSSTTSTGAKNSSGPIVADGKVISGRSCEPEGGPDACVITAFDAKTGKELWRRRTIPKPGEPGDETWGDIPYEKRWHVGMWMVPSYDPETKRMIVGTSVTAPAPKFMLARQRRAVPLSQLDARDRRRHRRASSGTSSTSSTIGTSIIRSSGCSSTRRSRPTASAVKWINPRVRPGEVRKVITGVPGKTGLVYTLDRETGQFLWARETVHAERDLGHQRRVGRGHREPRQAVHRGGPGEADLPEHVGRQELSGRHLQPADRAHVLPAAEHLHDDDVGGRQAERRRALRDPQRACRSRPATQNVGTIQAISVETGVTAWKDEQRAGMLSLMSTGGELLFGGDVNGRFRAYDQRTGEVLWEINLGAAVNGYPVTFAVDGKQYVAVSTGGSGLAFGLARLTPELHPGSGNQLFVFALP